MRKKRGKPRGFECARRGANRADLNAQELEAKLKNLIKQKNFARNFYFKKFFFFFF
jgi:hypothetical protein